MLDHRYANGVRATGVHSEHFGEIFCVEEDFGSGEDRFSFFPAAPALCSFSKRVFDSFLKRKGMICSSIESFLINHGGKVSYC